ncbi:E3 ubiquitin-protein ligase HUWE1-like, partial [Meleagris gallopavo]|uniref:E3 ubiquitin-protein ligase HUWE1-like n=1 Tax=Meleagris gallopavo TaxID=9103 RepID=UPI0005499776
PVPTTYRPVPITPGLPPPPGSTSETHPPRVSPQDCSVLAFVLDHLLPHTQNAEDKDTPALARLFLASLAAAGSGTDAQVALVNEVKAALGRALAMAESTEKHARLQAVMCIISTIMESCPSTSSFYSSATKTQHNGMNNIIRLFLKKGLVNDLARVPHSLDLSRYAPHVGLGTRRGVGDTSWGWGHPLLVTVLGIAISTLDGWR